MYSKQKENSLLNRWKQLAINYGDCHFTYDGLLLRGKATQDENLNWSYQTGNEEKLWQSNPKLLFITKDVNGEDGDDIRTWTGRQNGSEIVRVGNEGTRKTFFSNLMRWTFGLNEILLGQESLSFSSITEDMAINAFDNLPIARINCKKEAGNSICTTSQLNKYFEKNGYLELFREEVELFGDARIIYCGGKDVFNLLRKANFDLIKIKTGIDNNDFFKTKINNSTNLVINGFHPAYPGRNSSAISQDDAHAYIMNNVSIALRKL